MPNYAVNNNGQVSQYNAAQVAQNYNVASNQSVGMNNQVNNQ